VRTKLLNKTFWVVGLAVVMCGFAMQASALTLTFTEKSGFLVGTSGNLVSSNATSPNNDIKWYQLASASPVEDPVSGSFNTIAWGVSNNSAAELLSDPFLNSGYSGLRVLGKTGSVTVGGGWETISTVFHQNNSISSALYTLKNATIYSELTVGDTTDINPIQITFNETLNSGSCAGPGGLGTCPDEWTFNAAGFADVIYTYDGINYNAEFQLANFHNSVLQTSGLNWSFWTKEGDRSWVDIQMRLTEVEMRLTEVAVAVPEPATLALLGFGLLGLAGARKKFKK
jgi:hypothetical protein